MEVARRGWLARGWCWGALPGIALVGGGCGATATLPEVPDEAVVVAEDGDVLAAVAPPAPVPVPQDAAMAIAIMRGLNEASDVMGAGLTAFVDDGAAWLGGVVVHPHQRRIARDTAQATQGVRRVTDDIRVRPPLASEDDVAEVILAALAADPAFAGAVVNVQVEAGAARLSGRVGTPALARRAVRIAAETKGIWQVLDDLVVAAAIPGRPDQAIRREIEEHLAAIEEEEHGEIRVAVDDGRVRLSGWVPTFAQRRAVIAASWVPGVTAVEAPALTVMWHRGEPAAPPPRSATATAPPRAPEAVKQAAPPVSDAVLLRRITAALAADPYVDHRTIGVFVAGGRVVLAGTVDAPFELDRAPQIVRGVPGVELVVDQLRLIPSP